MQCDDGHDRRIDVALDGAQLQDTVEEQVLGAEESHDRQEYDEQAVRKDSEKGGFLYLFRLKKEQSLVSPLNTLPTLHTF